MTKTYTVKAGDTLVGIAFSEGFRNWETVWNHPRNQTLRETRKNPADLWVGDALFIPDKTPKAASIKTFDASGDQNQKYIFRVKSPKVYLSLILEDEDGDPYRDRKYRIDANTQTSAFTIEGKTDENGFFSAALPPDTKDAELTLQKSDTDTTQLIIWKFTFGATPAPKI